jgi:hypothetical protein
MTSGHADLGPELRQLAQLILDRLDPGLRAAAAGAAESLRAPGRCEQVWCPVCALAAVISGEQHPLLGVIAEHGATLLAVLQTMAASPPAEEGKPEPAPPTTDADEAGAVPQPASNGRYHPIEIVVEADSGPDASV